MSKGRLVALTLFTIWMMGASDGLAQNRYLPAGSSFGAVSLLRDIDQTRPYWGWTAGWSWKGRIATGLEFREHGISGSDQLSYGLEVAVVRKPGLILEGGIRLTSHSGPGDDPLHLPLRVAVPVIQRKAIRIIPQATMTWILFPGDAFLKGDIGIDCVIDRRWLLGAELNVNQDWRYQAWTLQVGALLP